MSSIFATHSLHSHARHSQPYYKLISFWATQLQFMRSTANTKLNNSPKNVGSFEKIDWNKKKTTQWRQVYEKSTLNRSNNSYAYTCPFLIYVYAIAADTHIHTHTRRLVAGKMSTCSAMIKQNRMANMATYMKYYKYQMCLVDVSVCVCVLASVFELFCSCCCRFCLVFFSMSFLYSIATTKSIGTPLRQRREMDRGKFVYDIKRKTNTNE